MNGMTAQAKYRARTPMRTTSGSSRNQWMSGPAKSAITPADSAQTAVPSRQEKPKAARTRRLLLAPKL